MATKSVVKQVAIKQETGELGSPVDFAVDFENVINFTSGSANKETLADFYKSYISFMENTPFIYYGDSAPENTHIKLWIDTEHPQNDFSS